MGKRNVEQHLKIDEDSQGNIYFDQRLVIRKDSAMLKRSLASLSHVMLEQGYDYKQWMALCQMTFISEAVSMSESKSEAARKIGISIPYLIALTTKKG